MVAAIRDLDVDPDEELVDRLYHDLLAVSFSADELDEAHAFADGVRRGGTLVSVALGRDGAVLGGVVGEIFEREGVLVLAYLVVRPDLQGRGIGTMLMEHVTRWYARPDVRLAVAEVHDPRRWSSVEGGAPLGRLRLFGRLGARVLGVPFVQPALGPGRARVPGFLLLVFHVDESVEIEQDGVSAVSSELVAGFVRSYYDQAEGARASDDAQLDGLLEAIEERSTIPLLAIAEYDRVPQLD
jgi:GNAT superfamily N-acetyltransferase